MTILKAVEALEQRNEETRRLRTVVELARIKHDRVLAEVRALEQRPKQNQTAIEGFRAELARARTELRAASRALVRSIG